MPVITVAIHHVDDATKAVLIERVTNVAVETTKVPAERFTVFIEEYDDTNIGCAGKTLKALKAGA